MIKRFIYGNPFNTDAVLCNPEECKTDLPYLKKDGDVYTYTMNQKDIVWGLGEAVRGMNKRGHSYTSWCTDEFEHSEEKNSLYGAHNFFIVDGKEIFGVFFDIPGCVTFDVGYSDPDKIIITPEYTDYEIYIIEGKDASEITCEFRKLIGESYIPPKWAFGIGQSRWGYGSESDLREVQEGYRKNKLPLDMIYLDIDYMQDFKDFTVNPDSYTDFAECISKLKDDNIRVISLIYYRFPVY